MLERCNAFVRGAAPSRKAIAWGLPEALFKPHASALHSFNVSALFFLASTIYTVDMFCSFAGYCGCRAPCRCRPTRARSGQFTGFIQT